MRRLAVLDYLDAAHSHSEPPMDRSFTQGFRVASFFELGDMNVDDQVNGLDVDLFVDAVLNDPFNPYGDMNEDGVVTGLDVDPFVASLLGGDVQAVPEPSTLLLCIIALGVVGGLWKRCSCTHYDRRGEVAMRNTAVFTELLLLALCCCGHSQAAPFTLEEATVEGINDAFDAGSLTSEQLVHLYLDRIDAYDQLGPALNSMIEVNPQALSTARALDQERQATGPRGPLHGIPVLLKDNYDFLGMPTTAGARAMADSYPPDDAFQVQRLREAGAVILGKTNLHEFALDFDTTSSLGGQTLNPYDALPNTDGPFVVPGGSSGGTGAAIAANFAVLGTGTDTGGSIRVPSAFNSLVGIKPTIGLTSRDGIVPLFLLRDVGGPMARTVSDAAVMLDVLAGHDPADPVTAASIGQIPSSYTDSLNGDGLQGARIGFMWKVPGNAEPHPDVAAALNAAISDIEALGAEVVTSIDIPFANSWYNSFEYDINNYLRSLGDEAPMNSLTDIVASGEYLSEHDGFLRGSLRGDVPPEQDPAYQVQLQKRENVQTAILEVMNAQDLDAILYPTATQPPPFYTGPGWFPEGEVGVNANLAAFSGFPAITVPGGFTSDGLPIGIELMGRPFSEPTLISLAYSYEQATAHRKPPGSTPPLPLFVPGRQSTTSRYSSVIYSVKDHDGDSDFDNTGDSVNSSRSAAAAAVGERDTSNGNAIVRTIIKFRLPPMSEPSRLLERATLRLFLEDIAGSPAGPVSLFHSVDDNDREEVPADFEDGSYTDTQLDLVQSTDMGQQYYELDVTNLVLADYAADSANLLSAFRLQVDEAVFFEDDQSHRYRFTMPGAGTNPPELVLTFIPEPSTFLLALVALGVIGISLTPANDVIGWWAY